MKAQRLLTLILLLMDSALGPGAEAWLEGRGGLRARILSNGILQCAE